MEPGETAAVTLSIDPTCPGGGAGLADPCRATRAAQIELEIIAP